MANWINKPISSCFLLLYFIGYQLSITLPILGENLTVPPHFKVINVSSLLPKPYCQRSTSSGQKIGSQKLEMVSRYGPCYPNAKTPTSESDQLLNLDQARVRSINKKHKHPRVPINNNEVNSDHGYYTVKIGLGTPPQDFNLMVDTGSKSTWVRCKSCNKGCKSDDPLYDPSKSSTYTNNIESCNGPFSVGYGDKSSVNGTWGCDTLTGDDLIGSIMKFRFVCGQEVDGDFGDASGVLGLGRGESSVTSQIASPVQMFSYYIPSTTSQVGNLYFGNEARAKSNTCSNQFTPLVQGDDDSVNYYLDLVGISVAGKKLDVPSTIFTSRGTIIDSGTTITQLPQVVYSALRGAFRQSMLNYTLIEKKVNNLDTCYRLEGYNQQVVLPEIKFHFGEATSIDVTLTSQGTVWSPHDSKRSIMCLAFAPTNKVTIIGNVQQRGFNVIYDLEGQRIGFGTNCPTT